MKIKQFLKKNKDKIWISSRAQELLNKTSDKEIKPTKLYGNVSTVFLTDREAMKEYNIDFMNIEEAFASIFNLIDKQMNGEKGTLLTNGCGNIVYVEHSGGRASVYFFWDVGEWVVYADGFGYGWNAGHCFFSRKPLQSSEIGNLDSDVSLTLESAMKVVKDNGYKIYKEF